MKQLINAFFSFPRVERLGIAVLTALLLILVIIRCTMSLWVQPPHLSAAEQARLSAAYLAWREKEAASASGPAYAAAETSAAGELFSFDPNTLDSAGFLRLGMPPRAVKGLLNWRRKGKRFYKPEDLKPLYNLPEATYVRLAPYIQIEEAEKPSDFRLRNVFAPIPAVIDLNTADSALLDRGVPGIGATLAHKIIQRRTALGGFIRHEQILEVYKFPDTTFQRMKEKLRINTAAVKKLDLNGATLAQLGTHPYVGEKVGKNILLYREGIGRYESVEQLRQVPLMNGEIYRKIAPYFTVRTSD